MFSMSKTKFTDGNKTSSGLQNFKKPEDFIKLKTLYIAILYFLYILFNLGNYYKIFKRFKEYYLIATNKWKTKITQKLPHNKLHKRRSQTQRNQSSKQVCKETLTSTLSCQKSSLRNSKKLNSMPLDKQSLYVLDQVNVSKDSNQLI